MEVFVTYFTKEILYFGEKNRYIALNLGLQTLTILYIYLTINMYSSCHF